MNHNTPGSSIQEILQARVLEQVVISFCRESSWPRDWAHVSCIGRKNLYHWVTMCACCCFSPVRLFVTPWTAKLLCPWNSPGKNMGEYWLPCPSPRDLPNPGIEPASLTSPALAGVFFTTSTTWEAPRGSPIHDYCLKNTYLIPSFYL